MVPTHAEDMLPQAEGKHNLPPQAEDKYMVPTQVNLQFVTPSNQLEWEAVKADAMALTSAFQVKPDIPFEPMLRSFVPTLTLVYADGLPVMMFTFDVFKNSAELHGVVSRRLKSQLGKRSRSIINTCFHIMFDNIFLVLGREKIICKPYVQDTTFPPFAKRWGFEPLQGAIDNGRTVWKLTKAAYTARRFA